MSEVKQVKVDNWGIFFLQRLKHFFNRTDYCDLTLQFQDNAQLKVHRLVLSACTEYFELLERTCEMYEDCLVMPDDLQADVVVPIVNFMYTGQLEFKMELLERLYQTSLVMNMPVLTKLLDAHRSTQIHRETSQYSTYSKAKRYVKSYETPKHFSTPSSSSAANNKRSYGKAFNLNDSFKKYKKPNVSTSKSESESIKKQIQSDPRPTRYELPEELEADNLFDNSFTNISYTSKPLMVHPETTKRYPPKRTGIFEDPSTSKRFIHGQSTMDIVECKKISVSDQMFLDDPSESMCDDQDTYPQPMSIKDESKDSNQLFDQILDGGPKVTIETKDNKQSSNLDHAKIISEVLKKYPHLVKSNKNIKLKILNTPTKKKSRPATAMEEEKDMKQKGKSPVTSDYTYESKVLDSKEAAKLIALGAENIQGPWICLICGAPGKAIHFSSYYKFRRHLVEVHNEKPVSNICEYCGHRAMKRNYLFHHLYTKHGVEPPQSYNFPKCNICNYVALTEGFLIKHKLSHPEKQNFRCNVCVATFFTSNQLLIHIQKTGHKYSADKKANLQCIYCFRTFSREGNLYAHLRTNHKESARNDGIIDISDDEKPKENKVVLKTPAKQDIMKYEVPVTYENDYEFDADIQYQIQQQPDGNIQVVSKKPRILLPTVKHKILNPGFGTTANKNIQKSPIVKSMPTKHNEFVHSPHNSISNQSEEIVMIDNDEYIVKDNHLIPKAEKGLMRENYSMSDIINTDMDDSVHNIIPTSSVEFTNVQSTTSDHHKMMVNKSGNMNQPIQIVVSNEEEYKALMASNHSIIFEDGDSNKTLTVLTGPHENNTTIDLDSSQSNDMMIIPENYPLNVTDTVTGNNSNIVVVYSHPVDDQNKEYQLITSENLDAQFVTSTAILTQNYETVTTSAPIMNAHVLETSVEDTWSNNIPQNIAPNTDLQIPNENPQEPIANLEEVHLPPIHSESVEMQPSEDINQINGALNTEPLNADNIPKTNTIISASQSDVNDINKTQSNLAETVESLPTTNLNDNCVTTEEADESSEQLIADLNNDNQLVPQTNIHIEDISVAHEEEAESTSSTQETLEDTKFIQNDNTQESTESETIENIAKAIQSSEVLVKAVSRKSDTHDSIVKESIDNGQESIKAKEQIQNLTSEWSDDEMETSSQEQSTSQQQKNDKPVTECEAMDTDSQSELEESIENIQHEMEKQLSRPEPELTKHQSEESLNITENVANVIEKDSDLIQDIEPEKTVELNETSKTPDKISSLLNDWEDNESQESVAENETPAVENTENSELNKENVAQQNPDVNITVEATTDIETQVNKSDEKTGENIERLVSDWVEDEDEDEAPPVPTK